MPTTITKIVEVSTEITRPADTTAYGAGDSVNTSTTTGTIITFTNVARVAGASGRITKARIVTDKKSITPRFRLHLFNSATPNITVDNAPLIDLYADDSKKIATLDFAAMVTGTDTTNSTASWASTASITIPFVTVDSRNIYGVLETLDAFTPASGQKVTVTLTVDRD